MVICNTATKRMAHIEDSQQWDSITDIPIQFLPEVPSTETTPLVSSLDTYYKPFKRSADKRWMLSNMQDQQYSSFK